MSKNLYSQFDRDYGNKINLGCPDYCCRKTEGLLPKRRWLVGREPHIAAAAIVGPTHDHGLDIAIKQSKNYNHLCTFYENLLDITSDSSV